MTVNGMETVVEGMKRMQQLSGEAAKAVLHAGGNELQRAWIDETHKRRHLQTGDMLKNIGQTKIRKTKNGLTLDVYPQGNSRPRGKKKEKTRNSVKAFVLHHGREGKRPIKGDKWIQSISEKSAKTATAAMTDAWGEFVETGTVPTVARLKKGKK